MTEQKPALQENQESITSLEKLFSLLKISLPVILGGAGGYLYYYFIGCASGTCPITGNPYISTAYGGLIGALFVNWKTKIKK